MSGILGFAAVRPQTINVDGLRRALRSLEQRGRDDRSIQLFNNFGPSSLFLEVTSERSLSPFLNSLAPNDTANAMRVGCHSQEGDLSSAQDRSSGLPDGRVFLAWDGVIDNGPELIRELLMLGQNLHSDSHHEILLAALDQWGRDCLAQMKGSFAFAVVDFHHRRLILAR